VQTSDSEELGADGEHAAMPAAKTTKA
jgi:hypothetical protein